MNWTSIPLFQNCICHLYIVVFDVRQPKMYNRITAEEYLYTNYVNIYILRVNNEHRDQQGYQ